MRGPDEHDSEFTHFVRARTGELHRTAHLLTADQGRAEHLVEVAVAQLSRQHADVGQAGTRARSCMARLAASVTTPTSATLTGDRDDVADLTTTDAAIRDLSPRERAVLLLRCLGGFDTRSTARELGLRRSKVTAAEQSASHTMGFELSDGRLRDALTDFAERATWPDPDVTLTRLRHTQPPRRHSRKRYLAAAVVVALTAATPIGSQIAHDRWLKTPAGINTSHGTHFHAYRQGYRLVGVQEVPAGGSRDISAPDGDVITLSCSGFTDRNQASWPLLNSADSQGPWLCSKQSAPRYSFVDVQGEATVTAPRAGHHPVLVAVYRPVPWSQYPVARNGFQVEHDHSLDDDERLNFDVAPVRPGRTLTMTGTNGVFSGAVERPPAHGGNVLFLTGLLSPSTTGQFKVDVDGEPMSHCSAGADSSGWCRLYDRYVPQIPFADLYSEGDASHTDHGALVNVRVEVRDALGPWKLQVRYDVYRPQN